MRAVADYGPLPVYIGKACQRSQCDIVALLVDHAANGEQPGRHPFSCRELELAGINAVRHNGDFNAVVKRSRQVIQTLAVSDHGTGAVPDEMQPRHRDLVIEPEVIWAKARHVAPSQGDNV